MKNNAFSQEVLTLKPLCIQQLSEGDFLHTMAEIDFLAERIVQFAASTVAQHQFGQRYESYFEVQRKMEIITQAFKFNFHPEKHGLTENLYNLESYVEKTYGIAMVA